jgi:hypothetical protein
MSSIDIIPTREDIFSVVFAGLGGYFMKTNPGTDALSQLFSVIIAKNLAAGISATDGLEGIAIKEYDVYTAGMRAGVSAFQKGGQNQVMYAAFSGLVSNMLGRFTSERVIKQTI